MKRVVFLLIAFGLVLTGCGSNDTDAEVEEVAEILKDHLEISPYIPKTNFDIGTLILEYQPGADEQGPVYARVSYFKSLDELEEVNQEAKEVWQENNPERKLVYGDLYEEPSTMSIEIYPAGKFEEIVDADIIDIAGHDVQYQFLQQGREGRDADTVFMAIKFTDVSYVIQYNGPSDQIEEDAKQLAEDIIKNNT